MPRKLELERKDNGQYKLDGLSERNFDRAMKQIRKQQSKARQVARNTITPALLRSKNQKELDKLSPKSDGSPWTREDLIQLEKNKRAHEKKHGKGEQGINYSAILSQSRDIDVKRANNRVDDNSGIKRANLVSFKDNVASYRVKASLKNGADAHEVRIRYEDWEDNLHQAAPTRRGYELATKRTVKGRVSIDCSCGRHQYWYRYLATVGNYCVAPPKEFSPPKIRNPDFEGVACKHVLHVLNKALLPSWINQLSRFMERQGTKIGGGSLRKAIVSDKEAKKLKKIKRKEIDVEEHNTRFQRYQDRQRNLGKKLVAEAKKIDAIRKRAERARKIAENALDRAYRAETKVKKQAQLNKQLAQFSWGIFKDANAGKNLSQEKLREGFADKMGISVKELGTLLDE